jgi:hypothetical protein
MQEQSIMGIAEKEVKVGWQNGVMMFNGRRLYNINNFSKILTESVSGLLYIWIV